MYDKNDRSVSEEGDIPPKPDKVRHLRIKENSEVVARRFQWDEKEDGLWIKADSDDCVNLYSVV